MFSSHAGSKRSGSAGLIAHLRSFFSCFGVPVTLLTDGGPEFMTSQTSDFLKRWGVNHRVSSAYYPKSNGRAELAVKKVKHFLVSSIGPFGNLDNDKFLKGMLQIRNTPDPDCKLSPAQIIFGRPLRDAFSFVNRSVQFENPSGKRLGKLKRMHSGQDLLGQLSLLITFMVFLDYPLVTRYLCRTKMPHIRLNGIDLAL